MSTLDHPQSINQITKTAATLSVTWPIARHALAPWLAERGFGTKTDSARSRLDTHQPVMLRITLTGTRCEAEIVITGIKTPIPIELDRVIICQSIIEGFVHIDATTSDTRVLSLTLHENDANADESGDGGERTLAFAATDLIRTLSVPGGRYGKPELELIPSR